MSHAGILQDLRVLITSVREREKGQLQKVAAEQGAVIVGAVTAHDPPHLIITRRVGSPKYFAALRLNAATPVVTPEWLAASVREGRRLTYAHHRAGAFHGLVICFSGLAVADKNKLAEAVTRGGGVHSPALSKDCTHLVTVSTDSDKYRFAQRYDIPCVKPEWLVASAAAGCCHEEKAYPVAPTVLHPKNFQRENSIMLLGEQGTSSGFGEQTTTTSGKEGGAAIESRQVSQLATHVVHISFINVY